MNRTLQWNTFRSKVVGLLSEVPMGKLQLFKFREMYEKRYHDSIGVSDLYKMKDVVTITEEHSGTFYFRLAQRIEVSDVAINVFSFHLN